MKVYLRIILLAFLFFITGKSISQVATGYTFSQTDSVYNPLVADPGTTPANIFVVNWDDIAYTGYTLPFNFYFNGTVYPAGTTIGLDTDGWIAFNPGVMTGQYAGNSWISAVNSTGRYLVGGANNNGFAAFNMDVHHREFQPITGNITNNSATITGIASTSFDSLLIGTRLIAAGIPDGTVIIGTNQAAGTVQMSANATATTSGLSITPASSIFGKVRGTAPNRQFVIQWTSVRKYAYPDNDHINFQLILTEGGGVSSNQQLMAIFGHISTASTLRVGVQSGLRGNSNLDYNSRQQTATGDWTNTIASDQNSDTISFKNTIAPPQGLAFKWKPACVTLSATGTLTGPTTVCPNSTQTYSVPAVSGAVTYTWTYTGANVSFSSTTSGPSNTLTTINGSTGGILSVVPSNACGNGTTASINISIPALATATISYPGSAVYCRSDGVKNVSLSGPSGGTFSSIPAGLSINSSNGQINPSLSTEGVYQVIYSFTSSGCPGGDTTQVTIKEIVYAAALALPISVCNGGNVQLNSAANSNYHITSIPYNYTSPLTTYTDVWTTATDEAMSSAVTLPFSFAFNGQIYTQFFISSNGYIQFGSATANIPVPQYIPNPSSPNNIIALAWANLVVDPGSNPGSHVRYFVSGTSPNRRMIIDFFNLRFAGGNSTQEVTGQIKLFESDNHVEIHAGTIFDNGLTQFKTMGMENALGVTAQSPTARNFGTWNILTPEAWSFETSGVTYAWSPSTSLSATNVANPLVSGLAANTTYTVQITDVASGCVGTATVPVEVLTTQNPTGSGGSRCGPGTVSLQAVPGNGNVAVWYDAAVNGNVIGVGNNISSPFIPTTTNFYAVSEASGIGTATVGNGNLVGLTYENIFYHSQGGAQVQFIVLASEMASAGLRPGSISKIAVQAPFSPAIPFQNFSLAIQPTSNVNMNGGLVNSGFTNVFSAANYTVTAGINTFSLSPSFVWDGISNIVLKFCWSNANNGGSSALLMVDSTLYKSCAYFAANGQAASAICGASAASGTLSKRPQFIFTGQVSGCKSAAVPIVATINPAPEDLTIIPDASIVCGPIVQPLKVIGGKYVTGSKQNILSENFETFPSPRFAATGGMISATSNTTFFSEGLKAVRLSYAGNSPTNLASNNNAYSMSSNVDMSGFGRAQLTFSHICALEEANNTFDAGYVQYSADGGTTWTTFPTSSYVSGGNFITTVNSLPVSGTIFSTRSYPDWMQTFTSASATPGIGPAASLWKTESINIPFDALTSQFRLRFVIVNDVNFAYYGWLIDNVKITGYTATQAPVVWTPNGTGSGLYSDAAATTVYTGTNALTVYARPAVQTSYYATSTGPTGCSMSDTAVVTVKPYNTWLGITSDWNDPDNWCPGVPTAVTDVTIPTGVPFYPLLFDSLPVARNIFMQPNTSIELLANSRLSIYGNLQNNGNIINQGTITLAGNAVQTYPGSGSITVMKILEIAKTGGSVQLDNHSFVTQELKPTSGTFALGNFDFTIRSADSITARVSKLGATASFTYGTGRFIVERFIKQGRKWRFLSVPTNTTQTINQAWQEGATSVSANPVPGFGTQITSIVQPLAPYFDAFSAGGTSIKKWATNSQAYAVATNTTASVATDNGWMIFVRGNRSSLPSGTTLSTTTLRTRGQLFTGNKTISATGLQANDFWSVGNPYASAIDVRQVSRSNVPALYYIWDPFLASSPYGGTFGLGAFQLLTLNTVSGNYEIFPGGGSYGSANSVLNKIESGAAFFVKASANGSASLSFTENSKADSSRAVFRFADFSQRLMVFLERSDDASAGRVLLDGALINFDPAANNEPDANDAQKLLNNGENLSINKNNRALLMMERRKMVREGDSIYLSLSNLKPITYIFRFNATNLLTNGLQAYLLDKFTGKSTPISLYGETLIEFAVSNQPASAARDRFLIVFRQDNTLPVTFVDVKAKQNEQGAVSIHWIVANETNIRDYQIEHSSDANNFTSLPLRVKANNRLHNENYLTENVYSRYGENFYRIRVNEMSGQIRFSKVVQLPFTSLPALATVAPNPVIGKHLNIRFQNQLEGQYKLVLNTTDGRQVFKQNFAINNKNDYKQFELPGSLAAGNYVVLIVSNNQIIQSIPVIVE